MFTGIVADLGSVARIEPLERGSRFTIATALDVSDFAVGESVCVNGACMTVVIAGGREFAVDVSAESLRRTTLGSLAAGDAVNLERSLRLQDRIGGHLVSGHVDGTGTVASIRPEGESSVYTFTVPEALTALLVEKGSVAVDGISLTCFDCGRDSFSVAVIPHTMAVTTLGIRTPGDAVNIENDVLGKYIEKLSSAALDATRGRR